MALDLSGVQRTVEGFLDDSLQLWRDVQGEADDVLDEQTGALRVGKKPDLVWEGDGAVVFSGLPAATPPLDGVVSRTPSDTAYQGMLPLCTPRVLVDDLLTVVGSVRDSQLVGCRFRITGVVSGSFAVVRMARLELLGGSRQPGLRGRRE
ncbi:DUF6093 family protein [Streptomyces chartreusis]|uniref:DUF6093 family protein n=1 Tax=Streptomyces chartreusis TaxID=1969 RepID=UPI0035DF79A9